MSFHFRGQTTSFVCNLQCERCQGTAKSGQQCKRTTCKVLPLCWQHLKNEGLQVKASTIPEAGLGLFTLIPRKKNDVIAWYGGERLTKQQLDARYGDDTAPYAIGNTDEDLIDGACNRGPGVYSNHETGARQNADLVASDNAYGEPIIEIVARKAIPANTEVFVNYGRSYWQTAGQSDYSTKAHKVRAPGAQPLRQGLDFLELLQ